MILSCDCKSGPGGVKLGALYQDGEHGPGKRVHNPTAKKDPQYYRCTVCGKERQKPGPVESEKARKKREKEEGEPKKSGEKLAVSKK